MSFSLDCFTMYQIPVGSLDVIRKTRRKVKHVLSDIGLEDCQHLLEVGLYFVDSSSGDNIYFFCFCFFCFTIFY